MDDQVKVEGVRVHRPNHNGTHAMRKVAYLESALSLVESNGTDAAKATLAGISAEKHLVLKLAAYMMRAGRVNEVPGGDSYHNRSAELFKAYAKQLGVANQDIEWGAQIIREAKSPEPHFSKNPEIVFCTKLLTIAHESDLVRCFGKFSLSPGGSDFELINSTVKSLITNTESSVKVSQMFVDYGIELCRATGSQIAYEGKYYTPPYASCSNDAMRCQATVKSVACPDWSTLQPVNTSRSLVAGNPFASAEISNQVIDDILVNHVLIKGAGRTDMCIVLANAFNITVESVIERLNSIRKLHGGQIANYAANVGASLEQVLENAPSGAIKPRGQKGVKSYPDALAKLASQIASGKLDGHAAAKQYGEILADALRMSGAEKGEFKEKHIGLIGLSAEPESLSESIYQLRSSKVSDYTARGGDVVQINPESVKLQRWIKKATDIIQDKTGLKPGAYCTKAEKEALFKVWLEDIVPLVEDKNTKDYGDLRSKILAGNHHKVDLAEILDQTGAVCRELSLFGSVLFAEYNIESKVVTGNVET